MSCSSCKVSTGRLSAFPQRDMYWTQELPSIPRPSIQAKIPQTSNREWIDRFPLGYSPAGLGYGGMYVPAGWGLWNYGVYRTFYPDTQPAMNGPGYW